MYFRTDPETISDALLAPECLNISLQALSKRNQKLNLIHSRLINDVAITTRYCKAVALLKHCLLRGSACT